ncbi:MAG: NAD-binding protein [Gemmatimonadota bacterium]|nr:NAD-binding protein [Gemmatimonadota bacterium]
MECRTGGLTALGAWFAPITAAFVRMVESLRETDSGVAVIEEDATRDRVLREAGIERARAPPGHIDQATVGPDSKVEGLTLTEAGILNKTGLLVVATHKRGQPYEDAAFNPDSSTRLEAGDDLIVLGDYD